MYIDRITVEFIYPKSQILGNYSGLTVSGGILSNLNLGGTSCTESISTSLRRFDFISHVPRSTGDYPVLERLDSLYLRIGFI